MGYFFKIILIMLGKFNYLSYLYYVIKDKKYENHKSKSVRLSKF